MVIFTCPKCGSDLILITYTTNPPQDAFICSCGWHHYRKTEEIRIPFEEENNG